MIFFPPGKELIWGKIPFNMIYFTGITVECVKQLSAEIPGELLTVSLQKNEFKECQRQWINKSGIIEAALSIWLGGG